MVDEVPLFVGRIGLPSMQALAYFDEGHEEQLRLSLILLDGASEALLRRVVCELQPSFSLGAQLQELKRQAEPKGIEVPHFAEMPFPENETSEGKFAPVYLSKRKRKDLDREYGPLVEVARYFKILSKSDANALKRLHEYRNRAYHRNSPNLPVSGTIVRVQLGIIARLMQATSRYCTFWNDETTREEELRAAIGLDVKHELTLLGLAEALTEGRSADPCAVANTLGTDLAKKLHHLRRRFGSLGADLARTGVTFEELLKLVQLEFPWPAASELSTLWVKDEVTNATLMQWEQEAQELCLAREASEALERYAAVDLPLSCLEESLLYVEDQRDREVQHAVDLARGK